MSHLMTALAMQQRGLKPATKIVLYWLADHHNGETGDCFPSMSTLADECEMNRTTVLAHLKKLEELGLIEIEPRTRPNGSATSNAYRLIFKVSEFATGGCRKSQQGGVAKSDTLNLGKDNLGRKNQDSSSNRQIELNHVAPADAGAPPTAAVGVSDLEAEFEKVWNAYPRKVGRGAAKKAWIKWRKKIDRMVIARSLWAHIKVWEQGTPKDKIPHLATWLNGERWHDDPEAAANRQQSTDDQLNALDGRKPDPLGDDFLRSYDTAPMIAGAVKRIGGTGE